MDVNENSEFRAVHERETYNFCSEEDKKEFQPYSLKHLHWLEQWDGRLE